MPSPPRLLLVRFGAIGDVLLITPLIRALRAKYRDATITALTKVTHAPLLVDNPHLDDVLALGSGNSLVTLAREIRRRNYSHLLDLHGNLRCRTLRLLTPGRWTGYSAQRRARRTLIQTKQNMYGGLVPVAERYFEAARDLAVVPDGGPPEFHLTDAVEAAAECWLANRGIPVAASLVAVAPSAAHATKRWPIDHWGNVVARLSAEGHQVLILGGPLDRGLCEGIALRGKGRAHAAISPDGLPGTAALLRRTRLLISGDTGLMHLATAVETPVLALFGPTVEAFGFFPYRARARVLQLDLPCRPCSSKGTGNCPLEHHRCMRDLTPEMALAQAAEFLS